MEPTKLYTCFEAKNPNKAGAYVHMIYSAKLSDLMSTESDVKPRFILEKVIPVGFRKMGCGVFGSQIVLAGGISSSIGFNYKLVTYDTVTKHVSREDFPPTRGHKIRPLVFELWGRLYVLDTSKSLYRSSFEIYYPSCGNWHRLYDPFYSWFTMDIGDIGDIDIGDKDIGDKGISGRTPYTWFVVGNAICMDVPRTTSCFDSLPQCVHNARQVAKNFYIHYERFPFDGMATTFCDPDFGDVVVISLSKGCVEGRRLTFDSLMSPRFGLSKEIFKIEPFVRDGEQSNYFTDCGQGVFCLTIFDKVKIHVYTFKISRLPEENLDDTLNLALESIHVHKYFFDDFSSEGYKSVSVTGCFALPRDDRTKRLEEAKLYYPSFEGYEWEENDDEPSPLKVFAEESDFLDNLDSDGPDTDVTDAHGLSVCKWHGYLRFEY